MYKVHATDNSNERSHIDIVKWAGVILGSFWWGLFKVLTFNLTWFLVSMTRFLINTGIIWEQWIKSGPRIFSPTAASPNGFCTNSYVDDLCTKISSKMCSERGMIASRSSK